MDFSEEGHLIIKNWTSEVAELISENFKNSKTDKHGNILRHVSVKDVKVDYENLQEVHQFNAKIHYLSDIGEWEESVIIRHFDSEYQYILEKTQYEKLISRTIYYETINPVDLIYYDIERRLVVYRSPKGKLLDEFVLGDELKHFQYGVLMGVIHGGTTEKLQLGKYRDLSTYLVNNLGFMEDESDLIVRGLMTELALLEESYAGYEPVTVFDSSLFYFNQVSNSLSKSAILKGEIFEIEILPSIMTEVQMDRMEDISTLFALGAYQEYVESESVEATLMNIVYLMEGYEAYFEKYSTAPIDKIYPKGLSLDLHMALGIWLLKLNEIHAGNRINSRKLANYSINILNENWFQIFGP